MVQRRTMKPDDNIDPVKVTESQALSDMKRDRSIDVLRGFTCLAMVLVNTAGPVRPNWLSHPSSIHQSITFADTLFPCFVFTSGLASAQSKNIGHHGRTLTLKKTLIRAIKLNLVGIAYNNLIPRLIGLHQDGRMDFRTYRIPSVLGTIGISSIVCALESYFMIKPPIFPAALGLSWYMASRLRPFDPLHLSAQAWLDQRIFGPSHLHKPAPGFDPEGLLPALLTVPISGLLGSYLALPCQNMAKVETVQLAALGIIGSLLTGLFPSPVTKILWTPTYVGQTTATSLLYWSLSRVLVSLPNRLASRMTSALEMIGKRSLEVYLISAGVSLALTKIGTWDSIYHLINKLFILIEIKDNHNRNVLVGLARSSLLGICMIPLSKCFIYLGWKI